MDNTSPLQPTKKKENHLPYDINYMPDDLKKKAKLELFEDEETIVHSLKCLKSMLNEEADLHWQDDDDFLLHFLRARKFDVKRAFNLMKTFYTVLCKHNELYYRFNYMDVKRTLQSINIGYLDHRDSEGCVVLVIQTARWNPSEVSLADIMRALTYGLLVSIRMPATQVAGFKVILDYSGITLSKIPHITPTYLWLFAEALQNCFPARFRAVHVVNEGHLFGYAWAIVKKFLTKKLKDRFHFHGKNIKKLHKYFSPSILPAEYEGEQPPFDNSRWIEKHEEYAEYVKVVLSYAFKKYHAKAEERKAKSRSRESK